MKVKAALMAFLIFPALVFAGNGWTGVAERIENALDSALKSYEKGDVSSAMEGAADAYFEIFESDGANMEIAVRQSLSLKRATSLEKAFTEVRKMMNEKSSVKEVRKKILYLAEELKKAAGELDKKGVTVK